MLNDNDILENEPCTSCPKCQRFYDEIDYDFQCCSKCGWDEDEEKYSPQTIKNPDESDYLNGDADILTGQWY